jgi:hypothetical protein
LSGSGRRTIREPKRRSRALGILRIAPEESTTPDLAELVRGLFDTARIDPDPDYAFADHVGAKYGSDLRQHDAPGDSRVVVTIESDSVYAGDMSA